MSESSQSMRLYSTKSVCLGQGQHQNSYQNLVHQSISLLKQKLKQQQQKVIQLSEQHKKQAAHYKSEIQQLKQEILRMKQTQYIQQLIGQEKIEQQKRQLLNLRHQNLQLKKLTQQMNQQLIKNKHQIVKLQQTCLEQQSTLTMLQRQKQKHLQISITEKINLQTKCELLQKELYVSQSILKKYKQKQIQLKSLEEEIIKKQKTLKKQLELLEEKKKQLQTICHYERQKANQSISVLEKENHWLKNHLQNKSKIITPIQNEHVKNQQKQKQQLNNYSQFCTNQHCHKEIQCYKNKLIEKSRQLAKLKTQLTKNIFKEKINNVLIIPKNTNYDNNISKNNFTGSGKNSNKENQQIKRQHQIFTQTKNTTKTTNQSTQQRSNPYYNQTIRSKSISLSQKDLLETINPLFGQLESTKKFRQTLDFR